MLPGPYFCFKSTILAHWLIETGHTLYTLCFWYTKEAIKSNRIKKENDGLIVLCSMLLFLHSFISRKRTWVIIFSGWTRKKKKNWCIYVILQFNKPSKYSFFLVFLTDMLYIIQWDIVLILPFFKEMSINQQ